MGELTLDEAYRKMKACKPESRDKLLIELYKRVETLDWCVLLFSVPRIKSIELEEEMNAAIIESSAVGMVKKHYIHEKYTLFVVQDAKEENRELTIKDARKTLYMNDSYTRLNAMLIFSNVLGTEDFFKLLGEFWSDFDNTSEYKDWLITLFNSYEDVARSNMMSSEALKVYEELPEKVIVYRGCCALNVLGFSWTLSREVAENFLTYHRFKPPENYPPFIIEAVIDKQAIIFMDMSRDEQEVIINPCYLSPDMEEDYE